MKTDKLKPTAADIILIVLFLFLPTAIIFGKQIKTDTGTKVEVIADGRPVEEFAFGSSEQRVELENGMVLIADEHGVKVEHSDCKDKICIKSGYINKNGQVIVCLPKKTVIRIVTTSETEVDAYAG